ncbi:hypothetical protein L873DRAFT_267308 [Choiromyces venosus 120613-1]|uniref:Uncharacterized protein n=1 Tax=Choiromyces venosus 120613-1 TaxID=1336337 RepID=A0A3N4J0X2_9PEZI|nr:hypothetical protein L873DRAFT_267308 [Choiromyces venosus 120613-1]
MSTSGKQGERKNEIPNDGKLISPHIIFAIGQGPGLILVKSLSTTSRCQSKLRALNPTVSIAQTHMKKGGGVRRKLLSPQPIVLAAPDSSHRRAVGPGRDMELLGIRGPSNGIKHRIPHTGVLPDFLAGFILNGREKSSSRRRYRIPHQAYLGMADTLSPRSRKPSACESCSE